MQMIKTKINFLHNARPYQPYNQDLIIVYPSGALPNKGDIIQIEGITHPKGHFIVETRLFKSSIEGVFISCELSLGVEGNE